MIRPLLVVEIPLEGVPRVFIAAASYEDERRLVEWLRRASAIENARLALANILDHLDEIDEAA